ncbi:DUF6896 domain-containing protein [Sorangium sp. So ce1078]|uniref:DUF6896 domain-containing protein n=1 Tax=Sorangium sp. So ce1078 TaxID=3133329 RepID=UPI003F5FABF6
MAAKDAMQLLSQYALLQGRLVRTFLNLYQPKDRETFRDVPSGTLSMDGTTWTHQRHGAGVTFVDPSDVKVNAHVGMAECPEGVDGGRLFEYLESIGVAVVVYGGQTYDVEKRNMDRMLDEMVQGGLLRAVTTRGRFAHRIFELAQLQGDRDDGDSPPDS